MARTTPFRDLLPAPPVVLVSARDRERGGHDVMAAAWVTPVSVDPPLVAVSIAPARHTHALVEREGEFVLGIPPSDRLGTVHAAGCTSGRGRDKLAELGLEAVPAERVGAARIKGCVAHIECRVVASHPAGDHTVFIAEVVAARAEPGFDRMGLLHHLGGSSYCTGGRRLDAGKG